MIEKNTEPFFRLHVQYVSSLCTIHVKHCDPARQGIYSTTLRYL